MIDDDNEAEIQSSILDTDRENKVENENIEDCLESDEEIIGIEDIEIMEDFTKMVDMERTAPREEHRKPRKAKSIQEPPRGQKDLRQWVKGDVKKTFQWKDLHRHF